tara:strand:- start:90 stop:1568 length:1479 start_codon:yes stop_codon:yes gene_type:complete
MKKIILISYTVLNYFLLITFISCNLFDEKPRKNQNDNLFEFNKVKLKTNLDKNAVDINSSLIVSWSADNNKNLNNPRLFLETNDNKILNVWQIEESKLNYQVTVDFNNFITEDITYVRFFMQQSLGNRLHKDSLDELIVVYNPLATPIFSPIKLENSSKESLTLSVELIEKGEKELEEFGICFGVANNPDITNTYVSINPITSNVFNYNFENLYPGKIYYARLAYKISGQYYYGISQEFITISPDIPRLSNVSIDQVTSNQARLSSSIIDDGGGEISQKGFCISTSQNPDLDDIVIVSSSSGASFESNVLELNFETKYYIRSYAINQSGVGYSQNHDFTTAGLSLVATISCDQLGGDGLFDFEAKCQYWSGTEYKWTDWVVYQDGYNGNCLRAISPRTFPRGGYVKFARNFNKPSKIKIWVKSSDAGALNIMPKFTVDDNIYADPIIVDGNNRDWMQIETPLIPLGNHEVKFDFGLRSTSYDYRFDEIQFWE